MAIDCEHLENECCKVAMVLAKGKPVPTTEEYCAFCIASDRPRTLNSLTCHLAYAVTKDPELKAVFDKASQESVNRPGSCLRRILAKLGVSESGSCQCDEYATLMDVWGTEGCRERTNEIVEHLNSQTVTWLDMIKVALGGYFTTESLVQEAIRQSERV